MGRPAQGYLHRNRHGTFSFRWRPPSDVRDRFDRAVYAFSLATRHRHEASDRAHLPAFLAAQLVHRLRMSKGRPLKFET